MTPKRDELAKQRQALPMVAIEKNYTLITESGEKLPSNIGHSFKQLSS